MMPGFRVMWLMVMFDLPVTEKEQRKEATQFRNRLLDLGFEMIQFSVYMRFCSGQSKVMTYEKRIESFLPENGKVQIITFTDKQYTLIRSFVGQSKSVSKKAPEQFALF